MNIIAEHACSQPSLFGIVLFPDPTQVGEGLVNL